MEAFTPEELAFLKDGALFERKESLTRRIQGLLGELQEALKPRLKSEDFLAPAGADFVRGQLVRGERFHHRPFVYLDLPKFFSRQAMFTFRSFFWWGSDFVFAWILSGPFLDRYADNLVKSCGRLEGSGYCLSLSEDPWEWRRNAPSTVALAGQRPQALASLLKGRSFLKVEYFLGLDDPVWRRGGLVEEGLRVFEELKFIVRTGS